MSFIKLMILFSDQSTRNSNSFECIIMASFQCDHGHCIYMRVDPIAPCDLKRMSFRSRFVNSLNHLDYVWFGRALIACIRCTLHFRVLFLQRVCVCFFSLLVQCKFIWSALFILSVYCVCVFWRSYVHLGKYTYVYTLNNMRKEQSRSFISTLI